MGWFRYVEATCTVMTYTLSVLSHLSKKSTVFPWKHGRIKLVWSVMDKKAHIPVFLQRNGKGGGGGQRAPKLPYTISARASEKIIAYVEQK